MLGRLVRCMMLSCTSGFQHCGNAVTELRSARRCRHPDLRALSAEPVRSGRGVSGAVADDSCAGTL